MIEVKNETEMEQFGEGVGRLLRGGEVIELVGDVGAGKTTFVRGLARGLEIEETIASPSFTISRVYEGRDGLRLAHYDFYRLHDAGIMANELEETVNDRSNVVVIEWAGAVANVLPDDRLTITISSPTETARELKIKDGGVTSKQLAGELA